jgi:subtilisin-like proprotein convertase family protein
MQRTLSISITTFVLLAGLMAAQAAQPAERLGGAGRAETLRQAAESEFLRTFPEVRLQKEDDRILRVYGSTIVTGDSPLESAGAFRDRHVGMFGVAAGDLLTPSGGGAAQAPLLVQPLVYLPQTDSYKFDLVTYGQFEDGIPVFGADLRLLVRNETDNPVVWAASTLRDLGGFAIDPELRDLVEQPQYVEQRFDAIRDQILATSPGLTRFTDPRVVLWAGLDDQEVEPRVALAFHGDNFEPHGARNANWLYVVDIETGQVLHRESGIHTNAVSGNASGLATEGSGADICGPEVAQPLPHLEVTSGTGTALTDKDGNFTIPDAGATVDAALDGQWFRVFNAAGEEVTESSSFDLLFNSVNDTEEVRAQVNAYVESNRIRDFVLRYNPLYPTFTDEDIEVNTNISGGLCPGNAWYSWPDGSSPTGYSINFCLSSSTRPNTAYASVVHHEFGHHLVQAAGSGQGRYGEGMGDVMSTLIGDTPRLGIGFFNDCDGQLRNADNNLQYPCSGSSHFCGQLISGCVWSTRNKLIQTNPEDYIDILSNLAVNAMLLHAGSGIDPSITIDYLTLDDDDVLLLNGTPHFDAIDAGFAAHNMGAPPRLTGLDINPKADLIAAGPSSGPLTPDNQVYTLLNADAETRSYSVTADQPWIDVTNGAGVIDGLQSADVTVALNAAAAALPDGLHRGTVEFVNETDHVGDRVQEVIVEIARQQFDSSGTPLFVPKFLGATATIDVAESFCIGDVNTHVDLTHPSLSFVTLDLESPDGTVVRLWDQGSGANINATFDDQGLLVPSGPGTLADFNGRLVGGTWTLTIGNASLNDVGSLNAWSLGFVHLGATCPPRANDVAVTVPSTARATIVLDGEVDGGGPLDYVVTSLPARGELTDPNGGPIASVPHTLAAGGNLVEYVSANGYVGPDGFVYKTSAGASDSTLADVSILVGGRLTIASFSLDADPGWTTEGAWAFGDPFGGGSHGGDPTTGFSGNNVYGYNLSGDYGNDLAPQSLTSGAIDCSNVVDVEVSFWRWLGVENSAFDGAAFQVSNDGVSFATIWEHAGQALTETDWSKQTYDISAVADRQPTVYLRWVMGATDSSETYPGWNIDDVDLSGVEPPMAVELTVTRTQLEWTSAPDAIGYDVVVGDLGALRSGEGDLTQAVDGCLENDFAASPLPNTDDPAPGEGQWILVRGVTAVEALTYETFAGSQVGLRDEEINASPLACP